jgi:uncharacterized membrane protein
MVQARFIRLIIPFVIAYLLLFVAYQLGAGGLAEKAKAISINWGMSNEVGALNELGFDVLVESFVNQLLFGYNDQLFIVAWTMRFELILSLFCIVVAERVNLFCTSLLIVK